MDYQALRALGSAALARAARGEMDTASVSVLKLFGSEAERQAFENALTAAGTDGLIHPVDDGSVRAHEPRPLLRQLVRALRPQLRRHHRRRHLGDPAQHHRPAGARPAAALSPVTETLIVERPQRRRRCRCTLNRPKQLNAINEVMRDELTADVRRRSARDASVNAVVLTGAGRGFCSGIDMRDFGPGMLEAADPAIDRLRFQEAMAALPQAIWDLPQPVIAAVNGPCVGGGLRAVPGRRHPDLLDGGHIRQWRDPAGAVRRRDGDELSPAPDRRNQRRRRLDADRPHRDGRRSRPPGSGQRAGRTRPPGRTARSRSPRRSPNWRRSACS